ncbi:hypothetical protein P7D22_13330 [Lichenihabitans sp. Uapishka_5]|uniref:helix-turn-helix domain-containing protein n=1 Tax=Lichenihabitans sp. Uapishka_5 TaxID=3037302 RepID=UPI0029E82A03|nr:helix-turn-helix domain-containing protein [Lichenihabitans sp. Uapishka_5]MDX7952157.1 hypothetical protein [Lichenihabitans sp. Uapishka_5]
MAEAATFLGITPTHTRRIVERYDLGRRINGGRWRVSRVALRVYADANQFAMDALRAGRRMDPTLTPYLRSALAA